MFEAVFTPPSKTIKKMMKPVTELGVVSQPLAHTEGLCSGEADISRTPLLSPTRTQQAEVGAGSGRL